MSVTWKSFLKLEFTVNIKNNEESHHPLKPAAPYNNSTTFLKGKEYTFSAYTTDPDGDNLYYKFNYTNYFGDVTYNSEWLGPYSSGETINKTFSWNVKDNFYIRVVAKDSNGEIGPWSDAKDVNIQ